MIVRANADQEIQQLNERVIELLAVVATCENERDDARRKQAQAELERNLLREELEDVQRENTRLRGWQDCAREIIATSQAPTANPTASPTMRKST